MHIRASRSAKEISPGWKCSEEAELSRLTIGIFHEELAAELKQ